MIIEGREVFCNQTTCLHNKDLECTAKILEISKKGCLEFIERRKDVKN